MNLTEPNLFDLFRDYQAAGINRAVAARGVQDAQRIEELARQNMAAAAGHLANAVLPDGQSGERFVLRGDVILIVRRHHLGWVAEVVPVSPDLVVVL